MAASGIAVSDPLDTELSSPARLNCVDDLGSPVGAGSYNKSNDTVRFDSFPPLLPGKSYTCFLEASNVGSSSGLFIQNAASLVADLFSEIVSNPVNIANGVPAQPTLSMPSVGNCAKGGNRCVQNATITSTDSKFDTGLKSIMVDPACGGSIASCSILLNPLPLFIAPLQSVQVPVAVNCFAVGQVNVPIILDSNAHPSQETASLTATCGGPGPAAAMKVGCPLSTVAGVPFACKVTAQDMYRNTATGYTGTVHFTSSDPIAVPPADSMLTNGLGMFNFTLKTLGQQMNTATDKANGAIKGDSNIIYVTGNTASFANMTKVLQKGGFRKPWKFQITVTPKGATGVVQLVIGGTVGNGGTPVPVYGILDANGQTTITVQLEPGQADISFQYLGDNTYAGSSTSEFTINTSPEPGPNGPRKP